MPPSQCGRLSQFKSTQTKNYQDWFRCSHPIDGLELLQGSLVSGAISFEKPIFFVQGEHSQMGRRRKVFRKKK